MASRAPSCASGCAFRLHGVVHDMPSPMATCSPSHLRHPTFCSFPFHKPHHPTNPQTPPSYPKQKEHSLLVLPSVDTIINFANKFFDMLTKKQSEHPQKVFQVFQVFRVFQVFQVFHFAFGPQNRPVLVQIRTNPAKRNYSAMQ